MTHETAAIERLTEDCCASKVEIEHTFDTFSGAADGRADGGDMSIVTAERSSGRTQAWLRTTGAPTRRRAPRHVNDRRPRVYAWHPAAPARRPVQPTMPLPSSSCLVQVPVRQDAAALQPQSMPTVGVRLTERGLAAIMIGFALAVLIGSSVVITQYLALAG